MAGGTVHLLVLPNAERFHSDLKKKIESKPVPKVNVPIDVDDMQWDRFVEKVDSFDKRNRVKVFVEVDDRALDRLERDLNNTDSAIERDLEINSEDAEKRLKELSHPKSGSTIQRDLDVDFALADAEMQDFHDHWNNREIKPKLIVDGLDLMSSDTEKAVKDWERLMKAVNAKRNAKAVSGVRNPIQFDAALVDTRNFMSKLMKNMNGQFSIGLNQMYDTYFNILSKMWKIGSKPLINLRQDWNEANNFADFFGRIGLRSQASARSIKSFSSDTIKSFKDISRSLKTAGKAITEVPAQMSKSFRELNDEIAGQGGLRKTLKNMVPDFRPLVRSTSSQLKGLGTRLKADYEKINEFTDRFLLNPLKNRLSVIPKTFRAIGRSTSTAIGNTWNFGKAVGRQIKGVGKAMEGVWYETIFALASSDNPLAERILGLGVDVTRGMRRVRENIQKGVTAVSEKVQAFGQVLAAMGEHVRSGFAKAANYARAGVAKVTDVFGTLGTKTAKTFKRFGTTLRDSAALVGRHMRFMGSRVEENMRVMALFARDGIRNFTQVFSRGFARVRSNFSYLGNMVGNFGRNFGRAFSKVGRTLAPFGQIASRALGPVGKAFGSIMSTVGRMGPLFKVTRRIMARIGNVAVAASRLAMGAFAKMAGMLMKTLMPAILAVIGGLLAMGGQAVLAGIMALAGAIQATLGGALLMLPAVVGAAAVSFAVLKIGAEGLKSAISSAFSAESAEDFEEAIADLPPAMQAISRSLRGFKPMWDDLVENVQSNMFDGLDDNFASAVGAMLPIFKTGAEEMALSWNKSFEGALDALSSPQATAGLQAIMDGASDMAREMEPVLANLVKAFGSLAEQGAKFLGPVGAWAAQASENFFNWAEGLKEIDPDTGKSYFDNIIESAKVNGGFLRDILGGAFGTLGNVFKAGAEGGGGMLAGMATAMQNLKEYTSEGNEGFEKMVGFMKQSTEFASQLGDVVKPLFSGILSVFTTIAAVGSGAAGGVGELLENARAGLEGFEDLGKDFGKNFGNILAALAPLVESLLVTLQPVIAGIGEGLEKALVPALDALGPFFDMLEEMGGPIGDLFVTVGEALGKILGPAMEIFGSMFTILEPAIPILDKIFFYVGEIIGVLLEVMKPLFNLRDNAVAGLLEALGPLVDVLGEGLLGVIEALAPLFPILGQLFADIVEAVTPLIEPLTKIATVLFMALIEVIQMVMPILPPLASLIGNLAGIISDILVMALDWLLRTWENVWPTISTVLKFAIDNIIVPGIKIAIKIFEALASAVKWAVEKIIVPVLNFLSDSVGKVMDFIKWVIDNVATPALDVLKNAFSKAVDGIKAVWDTLKRIFSKPITFFIDTVINKGVMGAWNLVMGLIGQDDKKMKPFQTPAEMKFHQGGVLPGHSVGKDNYEFVETRTGARLGLAGGEGIMRQEFVASVGGEKGINKLNEDARHGRLNPADLYSQGGVLNLGNFASGGVALPGQGIATTEIQRVMLQRIAEKYPMMTFTSGTRYTDNGNHAHGLAVDVSNGTDSTPAMAALARDIYTTYPGSKELIHYPYQGFKNLQNGAVLEFGAGTNAEHRNHVHWAMSTPPTMPFGGGVFEGGSGGGGIGGAISSAISWVTDNIAKVKEAFVKPISDLTAKVKGYGKYGGMALDMGKSVAESTKDKLFAKLKELNPFKGTEGTSGPLGSEKEVQRYRPGVIAAFKRQQEEPLDWRVDALLRQIWTESKGDPNVAQQIVDMNGTGESAGVGLYQVIPTTWAAFRDPELPDDRRNVEASHNFAVRYFRDKHHWNTGPGGVGLPKTGWKDGGVLPQFFDRGGEARGVGHMPKNTLLPERVLSPAQTKAFNDFVYSFMPEMISQMKRDPRAIMKMGDKITKELGRIFHELREGRIKSIQTGLADTFHRRLNGEKIANSPVDLNFDFDWLKRNQDNLERNYNRASKQIGKVYSDPEAYVEAEKRAREQVDKEREEAREKARKLEEEQKQEQDEEAKEKKQKLEEERKEAEEADDKDKIREIDAKIDKINESMGDDFQAEDERIESERTKAKEEARKDLEAEKKKLEEKKSEADEAEAKAIQKKIDSIDDRIKSVEKTVDKKFDEEKSANDEARQKEDERLKRIEDAENERIERAKADGSYYYGYKVFNEEGKDPREHKQSENETAFREFMSSASDRVGLGEAFSGLSQTFDDMRTIQRASEIAMPAYMAALNGDPSGLAYNIAVGQSQVISQTRSGFKELGPEALAGIIEMAISGGSTGGSNNAPFIGEVNSGMTQAELMQTLEYYEMKRARRGTGTTRVR